MSSNLQSIIDSNIIIVMKVILSIYNENIGNIGNIGKRGCVNVEEIALKVVDLAMCCDNQEEDCQEMCRSVHITIFYDIQYD